MRHNKLLTLAVLVAFATTGCATLFHGSTDTVQIRSRPARADVFIDGVHRGHTPMSVALQSKKTHTVTFRKSGYEDSTAVIQNSVGAGWVVLDVILGVVPVVIDAVTGDWYGLDQSMVMGNLSPLANQSAPPTTIQVPPQPGNS